ncbi:hypothetical protein PVL29_014986 [Vitis rotundifolia]|uniref:Diacylglycerol kinase n=1 Tax=Vitis rotundifolia TaxID=103349 RepID=A0AA38ZI93_VITRO|nr:hypothetical protein PVL29_014986 [Vitis rotundifolia]
MKNNSDNIIFNFQSSSVASSNTLLFSDSASSANFDSMDSPSSVGDSIRVAARSSVIDSFRGCGLSGIRIDKEELKRIILLPQYLRLAIRDSINSKDPNAGDHHLEGAENAESPECPIIVFINSRSGGRHGPELKERLQELMSREQVFDLSVVKPHEFIQYGLGCLEKLAEQGDQCAKEVREKMRIMVAGGDGTVGWVLGTLGELDKQNREPVPPVGIIPLGTGNDLSRSFGWVSFFSASNIPVFLMLYHPKLSFVCFLQGGSFPFAWKSAGLDVESQLPEKVTCYEGVFYNYFSIGMDAQVAYGFHHLRNERPYLAQGPISNKIIYSGYSCTQGWFFTPCMSNPSLRGLKNILKMHIKKVNCSEWEQIRIPSSVRAIVALNLHSYGSGRHPWGNLKPEYLEKKGFVEAHVDDGLLEIFGLKQGWHASFVMVELISAKHIAQAAAIRLEIRGGEWKQAYMQMDGEPWKQPINNEYSTFVEIKRVPFQSPMISGE